MLTMKESVVRFALRFLALLVEFQSLSVMLSVVFTVRFPRPLDLQNKRVAHLNCTATDFDKALVLVTATLVPGKSSILRSAGISFRSLSCYIEGPSSLTSHGGIRVFGNILWSSSPPKRTDWDNSPLYLRNSCPPREAAMTLITLVPPR